MMRPVIRCTLFVVALLARFSISESLPPFWEGIESLPPFWESIL